MKVGHPHHSAPPRSERGTEASEFGRSQAEINHFVRDLRKNIRSGETDQAQARERIQERLGETTDQAFTENGAVDFNKLRQLLREARDAQNESVITPEPLPTPSPNEDSGVNGTDITAEEPTADTPPSGNDDAEGQVVDVEI